MVLDFLVMIMTMMMLMMMTMMMMTVVMMVMLMMIMKMMCAGAAIGPLLTGWISPTGWRHVFYMLISANVLAALVSWSTAWLVEMHIDTKSRIDIIAIFLFCINIFIRYIGICKSFYQVINFSAVTKM